MASELRLDARGLTCPLPILRLLTAMAASPEQNDFFLISDDPATKREIEALVQEKRLELVCERESDNVGVSYKVRRTV